MTTSTYLGFALSTFILSAACHCEVADVPPQRLGQPLELRFQAVDGREVDLGALKGKVVLIDFWATWCEPCVSEVPLVKTVYEKFHNQGFEVVGVSLDEQKEKLTKFIEKKSLPWPQHFDGKGWRNAFAAKYGIADVPTMWLVNRQGKLCDTSGQKDLATKVARLLGEDAVAANPDTGKKDAQKSIAELVADFEQARGREAELNQKLEAAHIEGEQQKLAKELNALHEKLAEKCVLVIQLHPQAIEIFPMLKYLLIEAEEVVPEMAGRAYDVLLEHHSAAQQAGEVCFLLYERQLDSGNAFPSLDQVERLARAILKDNAHNVSKGLASLVLSHVLMSRAEASEVSSELQEKWLKETKDLLKTIVKKYGAIALPVQAEDEGKEKRVSGDVAKTLLFEMDTLMPGKTAPSMQGEYLDGEEFELAALRGNVVLLHFWEFG